MLYTTLIIKGWLVETGTGKKIIAISSSILPRSVYLRERGEEGFSSRCFFQGGMNVTKAADAMRSTKGRGKLVRPEDAGIVPLPGRDVIST